MAALALIAAVARNKVIGSRNRLPWRSSTDMRNFRRVTDGHVVIMGRKTFDSIGRPLPRRVNIVVSRRPTPRHSECLFARSVEQALALARGSYSGDIFVIGGASLYAATIGMADTLYLTEIARELEGDVFFPLFDRSLWREASREKHDGFDFARYERREQT